jgi:hypothetical protein
MGIPKSSMDHDLNKSKERAIVTKRISIPFMININIPSWTSF